jgi:hypothetical protein
MFEQRRILSQVSGTPKRSALSVLLLSATLMISGCGSERLLSVQFNDERVGSPPAISQEVGEVRTGDFGRVVVAQVPVAGISGNWVQLTQAQASVPPAKLRCALAAFRGDGRYLITMRLFIPIGTSASILFQEANGFDPSDFFRLEFHESGQLIRANSFVGRFPHDQVFSVAVNLTIGPQSKAEVTLFAPAHGSFVSEVPASANDLARNFFQMQLTTDTSKAGSTFFANDLSVIYNP